MPGSLARPRTLALAAGAELALALLGGLIAWLAGVNLLDQFPPQEELPQSGWLGVLVTLPMLLGYFALLRSSWRPLVRLRQAVQRMTHQLLSGAGLGSIAAISLAAGVGEEILFRGALQPVLGTWLSPLGGVLAASLLFGMAHWMSTSYLVLATLCGLYLGAITLWLGDLVPAIVAHALYDFVALWWLWRRMQTRSPGPSRR